MITVGELEVKILGHIQLQCSAFCVEVAINAVCFVDFHHVGHNLSIRKLRTEENMKYLGIKRCLEVKTALDEDFCAKRINCEMAVVAVRKDQSSTRVDPFGQDAANEIEPQ